MQPLFPAALAISGVSLAGLGKRNRGLDKRAIVRPQAPAQTLPRPRSVWLTLSSLVTLLAWRPGLACPAPAPSSEPGVRGRGPAHGFLLPGSLGRVGAVPSAVAPWAALTRPLLGAW